MDMDEIYSAAIKKADIMDREAVTRALTRIAHQIIERNRGAEGVALLGIKRRGATLAKELRKSINAIEGVEIPIGYLDITLYRDDLKEKSAAATVTETDIKFEVADKKIVLVDDVIYTGRTARAAIEAVFTRGRPAEIQLAVLIDRGHRELPIRPDYIGKNIPTSRGEIVSVMVDEYDGTTGVTLYQMMTQV